MPTLVPLLARHSFFAGMEPRYLDLIAGCAANARYDPNDYLFHEGEQATHFFIIRHGLVRLELHAPPRKPLVIETIGEGGVIGWSWLFPPYHWHFDGIASELTRATMLDGTCLRVKCEDDHDFGYELTKRFAHLITERLNATRLHLLDVYGENA